LAEFFATAAKRLKRLNGTRMLAMNGPEFKPFSADERNQRKIKSKSACRQTAK
jgi:hypothetical protein